MKIHIYYYTSTITKNNDNTKNDNIVKVSVYSGYLMKLRLLSVAAAPVQCAPQFSQSRICNILHVYYFTATATITMAITMTITMIITTTRTVFIFRLFDEVETFVCCANVHHNAQGVQFSPLQRRIYMNTTFYIGTITLQKTVNIAFVTVLYPASIFFYCFSHVSRITSLWSCSAFELFKVSSSSLFIMLLCQRNNQVQQRRWFPTVFRKCLTFVELKVTCVKAHAFQAPNKGHLEAQYKRRSLLFEI